MKKSNLLIWFMSVVFLSDLVCMAETKIPCLIFSGNAETEFSIELAKLNKISFGDNSMIISSSKENDGKSIELLYSLYHHIKVDDATPTELGAEIETTDADSDSYIYVDSQSKHLYLQSASDAEFYIGIFNISGNLLLTAKLNSGDDVSLESLVPGIYVGVASDGKTKLTIKFNYK